MGFVDKIIEKAENKIQKIKKKREQKELIKNFKKHMEKNGKNISENKNDD